MSKWMGLLCILLGVACLLSAVGIVLYNRWEADNAAVVSQSMLVEVQEKIGTPDVILPDSKPLETPSEMATIEVEGYRCAGILSVPVLQLELPVLTDWSYAKLKKAPCLYYGTCYEADFVIAAHNYPSHFGRLSELQAGDMVVFTDVGGAAHRYEVVLLETLPADATETMIASGFDLSLYTCTTGGGSRVTVRCRKA